MKLQVLIQIFVVAVVFFGLTVAQASATSTPSRTNHLLKKLEHLPMGATPSPQVKRLVCALARIDPARSAKYFRLGITRLPPTSEAEAYAARIATKLQKIIMKSALSALMKQKLYKQVFALTLDWFYPAGPGGLTYIAP